LHNQKSQRHNGYLKDMLISKFMQKNRLDVIGNSQQTRETEIRI